MKAFKSLLKVHLLGIIKTQKNKNTLLMIALTAIALLFLGGLYGMIFHFYFLELGEAPLGLPIMMTIGFIGALILGSVSVKNILFNGKDHELLMKLPIPFKSIITVKVLSIMIESLAIILLLSLPSLIMSMVGGQLGVVGLLISLILILSLGLLASALSMLIGFLYSSLKARFRLAGKIFGSLSILLTLGLAYLYIRYMMSNFSGEGDKQFEVLGNLIKTPPLSLIPEIIFSRNILLSFLLLVGSILLLALMVLLFSKSYRRLGTILSASPREKIRALETKKHSPLKALVKKDLLKLLKTPSYLINAAFLPLLILVGLVMVILNPAYLDSLEELEGLLPLIQLLPLVFIAIAGSGQVSAVIISLERDNFWILKTLPLTEKLIIIAKAMPQFLITVILQVLVAIMGMILIPSISPLSWLLCLIMGILWSGSNSLVGILLNLNYPKLDAENDTEIIKRSLSTMLMFIYTLISTGVFFFISFITYLIVPGFFLWILLLISGLFTLAIYYFVMKKGTSLFRKL